MSRETYERTALLRMRVAGRREDKDNERTDFYLYTF